MEIEFSEEKIISISSKNFKRNNYHINYSNNEKSEPTWGTPERYVARTRSEEFR